MQNNDRYTKKIILKDGRSLGYAELGNPNGKPIFYFNGYPGSRLEAKAGEKGIEKSQIRLISIDRPGMGLSDPKSKRTLLDWPDDVLELADSLKIEQFAVIGVSGGGPYSLACAYKISSNRLKVAVTNGGLAPLEAGIEGMKKSNRTMFWMTRRMYWLYRFLLWFGFGRKCKDIESVYKLLLKNLDDFPEPDQKLFRDPYLGKIFAEENFEAFRQGSKWVAYEGKLYVKPWGFKLEDISPNIKVFIFHGELDDQVPIGMARYMEKIIPNSEAIFLPNETHFGAALNHIEDIINKVIPFL